MSSEVINIGDVIEDTGSFLVEPGDYRFLVESWDLDDYQPKEGSKLPPCKVAEVHLLIPYKDENGRPRVGKTRYSLKLASKLKFVLCQFFESTGVMKEGGKFKVDFDDAIGKEGVCNLTQQEYGASVFMNVQECYPPSKAPTVTENDGLPFIEPTDAELGY